MNDQDPARPSIFPRLFSIAAILAVHFFTLIVLLFVFCQIVPVYMKFFEYQNVELPTIAIQAIRLSYACVNYWYLAVVFGMPADAIIVSLLTSLGPRRTWILSVYCHLCLLAVILLLVFVIIAMGVPIHCLTEPMILS